jgi:aminopeptidase N
LLERFYADWRDQSLIVDKWLRVQAASPVFGSVDEVRRLMAHPAYNATNPNKVRSVLGAFCHANPVQFHAHDGSGYALLTEQVLALDPVNPQITARLVSAFNQWRRYAEPWRGAMRESLERIQSQPVLSPDTGEIVARALAEES